MFLIEIILILSQSRHPIGTCKSYYINPANIQMENSDRKISVTRLSHKHLWHNLYIYFSLSKYRHHTAFPIISVSSHCEYQKCSSTFKPFPQLFSMKAQNTCTPGACLLFSLHTLYWRSELSGYIFWEETNKFMVSQLKTRNSRSRFQRVLKPYFLLIYNTSLFLGLPNFDSPPNLDNSPTVFLNLCQFFLRTLLVLQMRENCIPVVFLNCWVFFSFSIQLFWLFDL